MQSNAPVDKGSNALLSRGGALLVPSSGRIAPTSFMLLLVSSLCAHASHIKTTQETNQHGEGIRKGTYLRYSPKGYAFDYFRPGDEVDIHYAYTPKPGNKRREYWCLSGTTKYGQRHEGVWVAKAYVKQTASDQLNDGHCKFAKLGIAKVKYYKARVKPSAIGVDYLGRVRQGTSLRYGARDEAAIVRVGSRTNPRTLKKKKHFNGVATATIGIASKYNSRPSLPVGHCTGTPSKACSTEGDCGAAGPCIGKYVWIAQNYTPGKGRCSQDDRIPCSVDQPDCTGHGKCNKSEFRHNKQPGKTGWAKLEDIQFCCVKCRSSPLFVPVTNYNDSCFRQCGSDQCKAACRAKECGTEDTNVIALCDKRGGIDHIAWAGARFQPNRWQCEQP